MHPCADSHADKAIRSAVVVLNVRTSRLTLPSMVWRAQATTLSFVDIQSGTIGVQNFHVPSTTAAGLEPLLKKSNKRAPGPSPDPGAIWGAQGFPVRLIDGFAHTKETPTALPTAHQPTRSPPVRADSDQAASCPQMTNVRAGQAPSRIPSIQCVRISL